MIPTLQIRTPKDDAPLQATKWLKLPMLLEVEEMRQLLEELGEVHLYPASGVQVGTDVEMEKDEYLETYASYLEAVKKGEKLERILPKLAVFMTEDAGHVYLMEGGNNRYVVKPYLPMMTMQPHYLSYSPIDQKFRSQVFGKESMMWGVILSYPQLYQDPLSGEVKTAFDLPNGEGFKTAQKWVRANTKPTPFLVDGVKTNSSVRIGKKCFSWINKHPQLIKLELQVAL